MFGLFGTLEMGKRALMTQQLGMSTTGHNIANVSTPGFSRQRVEVASTMPLRSTSGIIGTGSMTKNITQVRDFFLSTQLRNENSSLQHWTTSNKALSQMELIFNEPQDTSLNTLLTDFWNSWESLSTNPDTPTSVIESSKVLVNSFHEQASQLKNLKESVDQDFTNSLRLINEYASQIADINQSITGYEIGGAKANDLRDKRDLLLDKLSNLADVRTFEKENGSSVVLLGSMSLVDGTDYMKIEGRTVYGDNSKMTKAYWENTNFSLDFNSGELYALQHLRDDVIPDYQKNLDQLAEALVTEINAVHRNGVLEDGTTNRNFFDAAFTTAESISIDVNILNDPSNIAKSLTGEPGDVRNAQLISELRYKRTMNNGSSTINEYYGSFIGTLGIKTKEASNLQSNYELLVTQLDNAKQSVQGVSIDEEMTQMIKYQRAYEAAARVITFADSALETIISGMGVTR